jgi:BolA protein
MHEVETAMRARLASLAPVALDLRDESAQHAGHAGARPSGGSHWQLTIVSEASAASRRGEASNGL